MTRQQPTIGHIHDAVTRVAVRQAVLDKVHAEAAERAKAEAAPPAGPNSTDGRSEHGQ